MARTHAQSITTVGQSPEAERHARVVKYSIAMGIRMLCVIACFFIHGWWLLAPAIGAIVLPYIGVVIANTVVRKPAAQPESPALGPIEIWRPGEDSRHVS